MRVKCKKCNTVYRISDAKVPEEGTKVLCSVCNERFFIKKEDGIKENYIDPDHIKCPKCGHFQPPANSCVKCGVIIKKFEDTLTKTDTRIVKDSTKKTPGSGEIEAGPGPGETLEIIRRRKKRTGLIFAWIFGSFFFFAGLTAIFLHSLSGIMYLLMAAFLIPPISGRLKLSKSINTVMILICFFGGTVLSTLQYSEIRGSVRMAVNEMSDAKDTARGEKYGEKKLKESTEKQHVKASGVEDYSPELNPFLNLEEDVALRDLQVFLMKTYKDNQSLVEKLTDAGMKDYEKLRSISSGEENNKMLADLKGAYYPNFSTILMLFEENLGSFSNQGDSQNE